MKNLTGALVLAALASGCARTSYVDPAETRTDAGIGNVDVSKAGELVVYTEATEPPRTQEAEPPRLVPTGYTIHDESGKRLFHVPNAVSSDTEHPTVVSLEPGRYLVALDEADSAPRTFWVRIEDGRRTAVDVSKPFAERETTPPAK